MVEIYIYLNHIYIYIYIRFGYLHTLKWIFVIVVSTIVRLRVEKKTRVEKNKLTFFHSVPVNNLLTPAQYLYMYVYLFEKHTNIYIYIYFNSLYWWWFVLYCSSMDRASHNIYTCIYIHKLIYITLYYAF